MKYVITALVAAACGLAAAVGAVALEFSWGGDHFRLANTHLPEVDSKGEIVEKVEITSNDATPKAKVLGKAEVDVGSIEQFTEGTEIFKIANEGDAMLQLNLESTTCKCTVGKLETNQIPPGKVAEIELKYKAESQSMRYSHGATIRTNDPVKPKIMLTVTGVVERRMYTLPEKVVFTRISANVPSVQEVALFTVRLPDFKVKEIVFDEKETAEYFEADVVDLNEDELARERSADAGKKVLIRTKPGIPNGPFRQTMRIRTNRSNDMLVYISGTVIADVTLVGGRDYNIDTGVFRMGVIDGDEGKTAKLYVLVKGANRDNIKVEVDSVTPDNVLKATLGPPIKKGKVTRYELALTVPKGSSSVNYLGTADKGYGSVILSTTDPRNKRIRVSVYFAVE